MLERPQLRDRKNAGISLSRTALLDLLSSVHEKGADFRFRAPGMSMHPTIREGDIITLSPPIGIQPVVGDILAFRDPTNNQLIIHRVTQVSQDTFLAKGDNTLNFEGPIPISHILGVVTRVERSSVTLFWPDIRRSPIAARLYFKVQHAVLRLKMRLYKFMWG